MNDQNYANHSRWVTGFHFILGFLIIIGTICSLINVWIRWMASDGVINAILIVLLFICSIFLFWFTRQFAIKAQDRAIRAEENFRHFILTRNQLDKRISMSQVIALRFAPDDEFVVLADRAARENLSADEIKRAIKQWKPDHHRA